MKFVKIILILIVFCITSELNAAFYVSPDGDDNNPGTFELPFKTITKAHSVVAPGDTIYIRGGVHQYSLTITISKVGTSDKKYYMLAYPGERPIIDFSLTALGTRGISLSGRYWYIYGLDIKGAGDNGMHIRGSYNVVENCAFYENKDTGLQLGNGAAYNQIINCDSYHNIDPGEGNADGFAPKLDVGTGNYFYGCRAWQNSDDGYDGYLRGANNITTTYENCWAFKNGYRANGTPSVGNGNGFKMGGSDDKTLMHNVNMKNCLAFDNRVKGFDQNNNKGSMILYNCTAYRNGTNYGMSSAIYTDSGKVMELINCAVLGSIGSIWSGSIQKTNSWMPQFSVTAADFVSIDTTGVRGSRNPDGSLPELPFMRLAYGSQLIDAGTDVGLPYYGNAPDIGAYESNYTNSAGNEINKPLTFKLYQNYPNPFNPSTNIKFVVDRNEFTILEIYNTLGQKIVTLFADYVMSGKVYELTFSSEKLSAGTYFYKLQSGNKIEIKKMLIIK